MKIGQKHFYNLYACAKNINWVVAQSFLKLFGPLIWTKIAKFCKVCYYVKIILLREILLYVSTASIRLSILMFFNRILTYLGSLFNQKNYENILFLSFFYQLGEEGIWNQRKRIFRWIFSLFYGFICKIEANFI